MRMNSSFQFWAADEPKFVTNVIDSRAMWIGVGSQAIHCSTALQMMFENATLAELDEISRAMNAPFDRQKREAAEEKKDDAA
jgi:hypothetical protein